MRLSCNGCRVLRKGCTDACTIRPCLQWIKTPEAQANATVFLAKFYGRAGLLNLLAASPTADLRPAVFRSLLYEACGRVVNPVYGAVGLLWSGTWHMCQAAVEAVLKGAPIVVVQQEQLGQQEHAQMLTTMHQHPPSYDIRHVVKQVHAASPADAPHGHEGEGEAMQQSSSSSSSPLTLHKVAKPGRTRFKRKRAASSSSSSSNTTNNNNNNKKATPPHTRMSSSHNNEKAASPELPPANNEHDEQHQHAADIPSSSQCHASSDDDDHRHQQHSLDNSTDAEAGSSHVITVADDDGGEHDDQEQQQQLGLHLTLGFFESATAPPPVQTHHTPAAADHDDDEPGPGLLLGFRFL